MIVTYCNTKLLRMDYLTSIKIKRLIDLYGNHGMFNHVAVIFRGNKMLAHKPNYKDIHAEQRVIKYCLQNNIKIKHTTILVFRYNNQNQIRSSGPCQLCYTTIMYNLIKNIIYSNNDDGFVKTKAKEYTEAYLPKALKWRYKNDQKTISEIILLAKQIS